MKIYFEDGELRSPYQLPISDYYTIDAAKGYSENRTKLDLIAEKDYNATIYTNQITALTGIYCWDAENEVPELYIRAGKHMVFTRVDNLTTRQLREGHNFAKMYVSGEFDDGVMGKLKPIKE